ncbi:uncharacterized protein BDR25DRAFT_317281 [Lindgomyces ingoldianus]|uniref:Uncharacterized protein n=1 Tax=Lindgomyces ingoldianus TaxID=673940 RepID=A0ACB6QJ81_9PLEO|nr:uncharacterized protein BDR25DRAFT_317281 [Lindgomyces ingoldianus]KAF2467059.1 hypothetical protein BDR25DRAFT_317281 [Lindgomyces ingoldianus]
MCGDSARHGCGICALDVTGEERPGTGTWEAQKSCMVWTPISSGLTARFSAYLSDSFSGTTGRPAFHQHLRLASLGLSTSSPKDCPVCHDAKAGLRNGGKPSVFLNFETCEAHGDSVEFTALCTALDVTSGATVKWLGAPDLALHIPQYRLHTTT